MIIFIYAKNTVQALKTYTVFEDYFLLTSLISDIKLTTSDNAIIGIVFSAPYLSNHFP